ncbi:MAG TPA: cyanophycin synthetase [Candidatus Eisenbacteria bacterium]|nr:cyanophycin synthetase [Candidatus Eisenbacteria bacterium]
MTRTAADIGAGLLPVREPRLIRAGERIHVIGAAGAGASAAALLAQAAGAVVSGCDAGGPSPYSVALEAAAIPLAWAHDPAHVRGDPPPDRLAVTKALTAVAPDHPELAAAAELGIPIEPWQQVIADVAVGRTLVAVAGTHGKSTTAGWLTHVLAAAGLDPAAFVGALLPVSITGRAAATARQGQGGVFVVEADEYAGNFDAYRPAIAILTNVEWDHPDVFADRGAVIDVFESWLRHGVADRGGTMPAATAGGAAGVPATTAPALVANINDPGVEQLLAGLGDWPAEIVLTALIEQDAGPERPTLEQLWRAARASGQRRLLAARIVDTDPDGTTIELFGLEPETVFGSDRGASGFGRASAGRPERVPPVGLEVRLPSAGRHNVANALCVAGAAMLLGLPAQQVIEGLTSFEGIGRRLERKGEALGVVVYDDYGHHPTAIRETLGALRQREPGRRLWAVYEPLTFHRTAALLDDFADVLALADGVAIADIWPGRDTDRTVTSSAALADAIRRRRGDPVVATGSVEATADWLAREVRAGDAVLVMGGGRSYRIGELLLDALQRRAPGASGTA